MATKPNVTDVKEASHVNRLVLEITTPNVLGEQEGGPTTDILAVEGIIGSPEGRALGSPGDIRFRQDVPEIWQKVTGDRTLTGWRRLDADRSTVLVPLLFEVSAAGSFDGSTSFSLPDPLPARNGSGYHVIPITSPVGLLDPDSVQELVGSPYWIRSASFSNQNGTSLRILLGLTQPKPSLAVGGNAITTPIFVQNTFQFVQEQRPIRMGPYVPPGFIIQALVDNNAGTPIVGPYELALELQTLPTTEDAARAIRSQEFPALPVTIA